MRENSSLFELQTSSLKKNTSNCIMPLNSKVTIVGLLGHCSKYKGLGDLKNKNVFIYLYIYSFICSPGV